MSLSLVLGPANSAKAGEVLGAYAAAARRGARLVVPTRADALHYDRELAAGGVALGRALTFDGLLEEIAGRVGHDRPALTPRQRARLVRRAVAETSLEALEASATTPGFPAAVGRVIAGLVAQRVGPERLGEGLARSGAGPAGRDLAEIYRTYVSLRHRSGQPDAESRAYAVLDALRADPEIWGDLPVFFYGFDDLTPVERDAVETLARPVGAPITVSLTYEPGHPALVARAGAVEDLRAIADRVRELPAQSAYYADPALHHLERRLFRAGVDAPADPGDAVTVLEAGGERAEAELVAAEVLAARRAGVPAAEIVVVTRSLARHGAVLEDALARYGVATTSARQIPFTHTALGRGVRAALVGDALGYLRLSGDPLRVDALEARARVTASEVTAELPDLSGALDALSPRGRGEALGAEAERDARAAAALKAALAELGGAGELSPAETLELIEELEIPANTSRAGVLIAEPLTIRARRFRRVFVTGLCDGEFPSTDPPDPFLGEERRRRLALDGGITLAPAPDALARERYLLYACVSRATERVIFSYRSSDEDGNQVAASPFLEDVLALFRTVPRRRRLLADVLWDPEEAPTPREFELAQAAQRAGHHRDAGPGDGTRRLTTVALGHVRHTERVSPGAMESFARCPVAWLIERQLRPDELAPEPEAIVKGIVLHDLLKRLGTGEIDADALESLPVPDGLAPGRSPAVRQAVLDGIVAELRRYLHWARAQPSPAFTPTIFEHAFRVTLADGLEVTGTIDRIDTHPDGRAIVVDYKSGRDRPGRAGSHWLDERNFQAALYMLAARRELGLSPVAGLYQPLSGSDLRPRGAALADVEVPVRAGDRRDMEGLEALLAEVEAEVARLAGLLGRGELTPCPETCSPDGCRHPGICWAGR